MTALLKSLGQKDSGVLFLNVLTPRDTGELLA